ncbi:MAG TPA: hypothetical protein VF278_14880 [Pirellulales bacterium]
MLRDELFVLRNACSAVGSLAAIVARGPQPDPAPPGASPLAIIERNFGPSDVELVGRLEVLGPNLVQRAETIAHALEWEMHLSEAMENETRTWLSNAAHTARELLRMRSRVPSGVVLSDRCSQCV